MNPLVKGAVASKSVWLGAILVFLGAMTSTVEAWKNAIPLEYQGLFISFIGAVVIALRAVTTESLAEKGK